MTKLSKNHPFIVEAFRLEKLAVQEGASDSVVAGRIKLQKDYPEYFAEYMEAKKKKESLKLEKEKVLKEIQMRERFGYETITYLKNKIESRKQKNRSINSP
jgi:hypothetical protein